MSGEHLMAQLEATIAGERIREAYADGLRDGALLALFPDLHATDDHTIFGTRVRVTVEWLDDGPKPPSRDRFLRRLVASAAARRQQMQEGS